MTSPSVWLDRQVGRVTMYRLVLIVLLVLALAALIGTIAGAVPFSPLAVVVDVVIAVGVGYGANRLFAAIWGIRPHGDSAVVTGLLVFCLFWPVLDGPDILALVLAVVAATASKYVLAWRGRHIFNPAATGAVVVTVAHVGGATWWVATPFLLPVIVIGGALVLYRVRAFDVAGLVVLITVPGTAAILVATGTPLKDAVEVAIASYPYLFFAAFMVSEPLTLPPRRRQRLLVGAVIGVVALLPLHLGWIAMAPEIALIVGNAVAFAFGPRRRVRLTLVERRALPGAIGDLTFRPESPLRFLAGQYVELSLPHGGQDGRGARRMFSAASRPGAPELRIVTRWSRHSSSFKKRLETLQPGEAIAGSSVGGDFLLPRKADVPLLWIAGGVGITPFASFADELAARAEHRDVVLVQVVHGEGDLLFAPLFDAAGVRVLVVGPEELIPVLPAGWVHAADDLARLDLKRHVPDARSRTAFVAGSPAVVDAARRAARSAGVRRVRRDRFLGY
jgi:ferredoxin-NADP reductase/Na+-translocating ferredoxin:NAD+ oxidoreductase RnfD subunit